MLTQTGTGEHQPDYIEETDSRYYALFLIC